VDGSHVRQRRGRRAVGTAVTLAVAVLGWFVWAAGLGRYVENYCFSRIASGGSGGAGNPAFTSPVHLRCTYDDGTVVTVLDLRPLLWTLGALTVGALVVGAVWAALVVRTPTAPEPVPPDDRPLPIGSRVVLAATGFVLALPAVVLTLISGWSLLPPGPERLRESAAGLVLVAVCAFGSVTCLREAAGGRAWWLALALLPPGWYVAAALGA
jgi:hypothetical protein